MAYADFAFYPEMKLVLFFLNCFFTTLSYYWGANLILKIYQKEISFGRRISFGFVCAMTLQILIAYGVSYLNGYLNGLTTTSLGYRSRAVAGVFRDLISVMSPLSYFVLYQLCQRVLKLSKAKLPKIAHQAYVFFLCSALAKRITRAFFFMPQADPRGYNFLNDILILLSGTCIVYIFYKSFSYLVSKLKLYVDIPHNLVVGNARREFHKGFWICCVFYAICTLVCYSNADGFHYVALFLAMIAFTVISVNLDYISIHKNKLANKDEHIAILNQSIDEFRSIKHDFNNILQTYSGYLTLGDLDHLRAYHQKVSGTTVYAGTRLDLSQRLAENPTFFSLLMKKIETAKQAGVSIQVMLLCSVQYVYIDEVDFTRVMGILLDNAIEAAQLTATKRMEFSCQQKPDGSKLFVLTNDVARDFDLDRLFVSGFTTKRGHNGLGLPQARGILDKYGHSMHVTCHRGRFTTYLELKPVK